MEYPEQRYVRIGLYRSQVMVDLESEPGHLELRDQDSAHSKSTAGELQAIVLEMQGNPSDLQQYSVHISGAAFVCRGNVLSTYSERSRLFAEAIALFPANRWRSSLVAIDLGSAYGRRGE